LTATTISLGDGSLLGLVVGDDSTLGDVGGDGSTTGGDEAGGSEDVAGDTMGAGLGLSIVGVPTTATPRSI
jgi:hypothetical protein